jgi:hypothetical protein
MIMETAVDPTILALISSRGQLDGAGSLKEVHTVDNKPEDHINCTSANTPTLVLQQCDDLGKRSRLDNFGPDIV